MNVKLLSTGLAAALVLGALAPTTAKAGDHGHGNSGYYITKVVGRDSCGRPVYQKVWVPSNNGHGYASSGNGHSHGNSGHGKHGSRSGGSIHAPGVDIHFGSSSSGHKHNH